MHPRSKHWHLTDYVIGGRKDRQDVRVTKTMCGADLDRSQACCQQNKPAHSALRRPQGKKVPKKLDVSKLKQDSKRQAFVNYLCSRLDTLEHSSEDVGESWTDFRDTVHSSAMDSLGPVSRKHQDWGRPRWLSWMRRPTGDQEIASSTPAEVGNILSWRLIMKYFLRLFSSFRWFKKGSCQFLAKECAQYWLTA